MTEPYKPIPVIEAKSLAERFDKSIVIVCAWDPAHGLLHTTTYGVSEQEKHWAALGGEKATRALGGLPELGTTFEDFRKLDLRKVEALKVWYAIFAALLDGRKSGETDEWLTGKLRQLHERIKIEMQDVPAS